jgi:hypothetical protein
MRGQIQQALHYTKEAVLLLRKHPSLFFIPLFIGVFGQVETRVGTYLANHHTGWGHDYNEYKAAQNMRKEKNPRSAEIQQRIQRAMRSMQWAMLVYTPIPPEISFGGSIALLEALSYGREQHKKIIEFSDLKRSFFQTTYLGGLIRAFIGAITGVGYLFILWNTITSKKVRWQRFLSPGWRVWLRFLVYTTASLFIPFGLPAGFAIFSPSWILISYLLLPFGILFAFTQFILVVDKSGIITSLRMSAKIVKRNFATTFILTLLTGFIYWSSFRFFPSINQFLTADWRTMSWSFTQLPEEILMVALTSIVAAWFSAAMLIWYHDIKQREIPEIVEATS